MVSDKILKHYRACHCSRAQHSCKIFAISVSKLLHLLHHRIHGNAALSPAPSSVPSQACIKGQAACGNRYLKRWTSEWEADLEARPEEDKDSSSGTVATTQFLQTMAFFKPLFKQLKRRQVSAVLEIMMALVA